MGAHRLRSTGKRPAKRRTPLLRAVRQAFIDYGFEPEDAMLRSFVVFASGVGLMHASGPTPAAPPELLDRFLDFMLRP